MADKVKATKPRVVKAKVIDVNSILPSITMTTKPGVFVHTIVFVYAGQEFNTLDEALKYAYSKRIR